MNKWMVNADVASKEFSDKLAPAEKPVRRRRVTTINLKWLAEQVRKATAIKDQLASGQYRIDSTKIAEALLNRKKD